MLTKALIVDIEHEKFPQEYLGRIRHLFPSVAFASSKDPNFKKILRDVEVILCLITTPITKEIIDAAPQLQYIGVRAASFSAIDAMYARSKNITVCNLGGYSTNAVAEFTIAALFEAARGLEAAKQRARSGVIKLGLFASGMELRNKVLGVIGAGKIGSRVAEIGIGIGMRVVYVSRHNKPHLETLGARRVELDALLAQSDAVSLNLLLDKATTGIISKEKITLLKKGCIFVSPSPHALIDGVAMREKAERGDITFVFDHAYELSPEEQQQFLQTKNCSVYAPIAIDTPETITALWETLTSNIEKFINGTPQNVVN